jgi:shikimate dehydrogenase
VTSVTAAPIVDGSSLLLPIVGHPIAQVKSPEVWSAMFRFHGINAVCVPVHVRPEHLATFFRAARELDNLCGVIVTIPHKVAALDLVDDLHERSRLAQSVNFVAFGADGRWLGDTVDGTGFVGNLRTGGDDPRGKRTLLVGAGGVGTAIAFALADAGVPELVLFDVDGRRADDVATRLRAAGYEASTGTPDPAGFDLVVNATPVGMQEGDPLPIDVERIEPGTVVADVIVEPTRLTRLAGERGCRVHFGAGMMNHQLAPMAEHLGYGHLDWSAETVTRVASGIVR